MVSKRDLDVIQPFLTNSPNKSGEARMHCPVHGEDNNPSASFNASNGQWYCQACKEGGDTAHLIRAIRASKKTGSVTNIQTHRKPKEEVGAEAISDSRVRQWIDALRKSPMLLEDLTDRGLNIETLDKYEIGYDYSLERHTIPVRDSDGALVNVRRYRQNPARETIAKMINAEGHGSPPRLYPAQNLGANPIIICEGEWDALITTQNGFSAVTGTHGSGIWESSWSPLFKGKTVFVIYDNDKEGRAGARRAAKGVARYAAKVSIVELSNLSENGDLTDWWRLYEADAFKALLANAEALVKAEASPSVNGTTPIGSPKRITVADSMDARKRGPLEMAVTIIGKKNPAYSVPYITEYRCEMNAGAKCKHCPMFIDWDGNHKATIFPKESETIAQFIDVPERQVNEVLRKNQEIVKCNQLTIDVLDLQPVEELAVTGIVDKQEDQDNTQRRVYIAGHHNTKANSAAIITGQIIANPKDQRNEFFCWKLIEAETSIDNFQVTPEFIERMKIFQPNEEHYHHPEKLPAPWLKCREIAKDLSNVTRIVQRDRLHICADLVFHSPLNINFNDSPLSRGWLELLVVGETRTGKSECAKKLCEHYRLGRVVNCENATFAGLVVGLTQIGNAWFTTWGEWPRNDRRLIVADEASGMDTKIIGDMSDVRSSGIARQSKIQVSETQARVRSIWIGNPRNEKTIEGIKIIEEVIGAPEDIARFDFAMSVRSSDIRKKEDAKEGEEILEINEMRPAVAPKYTSDLCNELINWGWSRKAENIKWGPGAEEKVLDGANRFSKMYIESPPLIQGANVREKIVRIAAAFAIRTFSTDDTGENVIVGIEHIRSAYHLLDELYSYPNFGYRGVSERAKINLGIAEDNREETKRLLLEKEDLFNFLIEHGESFRGSDVNEYLGIYSDETNLYLSKLSKARMIRKDKSQYIAEITLVEILKEIEKERKKVKPEVNRRRRRNGNSE